jgi:MFS transporter, DHA1 family, inner membrane transport protein
VRRRRALWRFDRGAAVALRAALPYATEGGWDVGAAGGCLLAAVLLWAGAPIWCGVLLSLPGATASYVMMRRYYEAGRP